MYYTETPKPQNPKTPWDWNKILVRITSLRLVDLKVKVQMKVACFIDWSVKIKTSSFYVKMRVRHYNLWRMSPSLFSWVSSKATIATFWKNESLKASKGQIKSLNLHSLVIRHPSEFTVHTCIRRCHRSVIFMPRHAFKLLYFVSKRLITVNLCHDWVPRWTFQVSSSNKLRFVVTHLLSHEMQAVSINLRCKCLRMWYVAYCLTRSYCQRVKLINL